MDDELHHNESMSLADTDPHQIVIASATGARGRLFSVNGKWDFEGDVTETARLFFENIVKHLSSPQHPTRIPTSNDINDAIDAWHNNTAGESVSLREWLGWSEAQYAHWVETGKLLVE